MVSGSPSEAGDDSTKGSSSPFTYTEKFKELFPYYLAIGMTYEQFWNEDPELAKYYRKADEVKRERMNQEMWWQGMYIYEAICCVSPILQAFAKKGTKPKPYPEEPHPITNKQRKKEKVNREVKGDQAAKRFMEAFMAANNVKFRKDARLKGSEENVDID